MDNPKNKVVHTPGILWFEGESPMMLAAIRAAQESFSSLETILESRPPSEIDAAAVKAFFPSPDDPLCGEHMWVNDVAIVKGGIQGVLANDANGIPGLLAGRVVDVPREQISDWFYVIDGLAEGGFTIKVMLEAMSTDEFEMYRHDPPTCYFSDWYSAQRRTT